MSTRAPAPGTRPPSQVAVADQGPLAFERTTSKASFPAGFVGCSSAKSGGVARAKPASRANPRALFMEGNPVGHVRWERGVGRSMIPARARRGDTFFERSPLAPREGCRALGTDAVCAFAWRLHPSRGARGLR